MNKIQMNDNMGVILFDIKGAIFGMNTACFKKYQFTPAMVCSDLKQSYLSIYNIFLGLDKMLED